MDSKFSVRKQGITNTTIAMVGLGIGFVNGTLLFPNFLTSEELGLTRLMIQLTMIFTQVSTLGLGNPTIRFFPLYKNERLNNNKFLPLILILSSVGLVIALGILLLSKPILTSYYYEKSRLIVDYYLFLIPLGIFYHFFQILFAWSRANLLISVPSGIWEIALRFLQLIVIVVFGLGKISFDLFVLLFVSTYFMVLLILGLYLIQKNRLRVFPLLGDHKIRSTKYILKHGLYSQIGSLSNTLTLTFDAIMLAGLISLSSVGIYTTGVYISSILTIGSKSLGKIVAPISAKLFQSNSKEELEKLFKNSVNVSIITATVLFLGVWVNIGILLDFLPAEYSECKDIFFIYGIAQVFGSYGAISSILLINSKIFKINMQINIVYAILMISLNMLLIPIWEIEGAAIATGISLFIIAGTKTLVVIRQLKVSPLNPILLKIALILGIGIAGSFALTKHSKIFSLDFVVNNLILAVYLAAAFAISGIFTYLKKTGVKPANPD